MATSIRAKHPLKKGTVVSLEDLQFMAPDDGLAPWEIENIIGKSLKRNLQNEELILHNDLD